MRRRGLAVSIALVLCALFGAVPFVLAQDEPFPVEISVGETFEVCTSGQILCPAIQPICDDLKVVLPVDTPGGLGFRGVGPGSTLCSAGSAAGPRRVFRITVR